MHVTALLGFSLLSYWCVPRRVSLVEQTQICPERVVGGAGAQEEGGAAC